MRLVPGLSEKCIDLGRRKITCKIGNWTCLYEKCIDLGAYPGFVGVGRYVGFFFIYFIYFFYFLFFFFFFFGHVEICSIYFV